MNRTNRTNVLAGALALLPSALLLTGCSGSATTQPRPTSPGLTTVATTGTTATASKVDTNTALRTATLGTYHSLEATISSLLLLDGAPSKDARRSRAALTRLSLFHTAHAPTRDAPLFNYDSILNLYNSTSRSGQTFTYNFFSDAAGTLPVGTATLLLPVSTDTYPYTTSLQFNVTGGNFPGSGSGSLTYTSDSAISIDGKLHINADASDSQLTLAVDTNANGTVSGSGSIVTNSVNVQLTNFSGSESSSGSTTSVMIGVMPVNYKGALVLSSDSNGNNGTLTLTLTSGASTFKAIGILTDANGNTVQNPTFTLTYPDGTQQTISNPATTPAK